MRRSWGANRAAVIDYLVDNPGASPTGIAKATGISIKAIHTLLFRLRQHPWRGHMVLNLNIQVPTYLWLRRTCPDDVSMADHIVSILVDAMHEDIG